MSRQCQRSRPHHHLCHKSTLHRKHLTNRISVVVSSVLLDQNRAQCHPRVVVAQEQPQATLVHQLRLAERERLSHEPRQALPERGVEPLDVAGLAAAIVTGDVLTLRHHLLARLPKVRERQHMTQPARDTLPEQAASLVATVADSVGNDLAHAAAQGQPNPPLVLLSCCRAAPRTTRVRRVPARPQARRGRASLRAAATGWLFLTSH